jgi:hypothetical protein
MERHVTPVTGCIPDGQENGFAEALRLRERVRSPLPPVDRIVLVLQQVRARGVGKSVRHHGPLSSLVTVTPNADIVTPTWLIRQTCRAVTLHPRSGEGRLRCRGLLTFLASVRRWSSVGSIDVTGGPAVKFLACRRDWGAQLSAEIYHDGRTSVPPCPAPIAVAVSSWANDPYSGGGYTHIPPGADPADADLLGQPIGGRLLFAGGTPRAAVWPTRTVR